jgi:hypothetical protein
MTLEEKLGLREKEIAKIRSEYNGGWMTREKAREKLEIYLKANEKEARLLKNLLNLLNI